MRDGGVPIACQTTSWQMLTTSPRILNKASVVGREDFRGRCQDRAEGPRECSAAAAAIIGGMEHDFM